MATYLVLQNTYHLVQCALFEHSTRKAFLSLDKIVASAQLIPAINTLLESQNTALTDLDFIAVNQGPGPFTTLRVVIATANGLAFASGLPLIGVDGLDALEKECANPFYTNQVALLNAFNNDVYFAIKTEQGTRKGVRNIGSLTQELVNLDGVMHVFGNGAQLYEKQLRIALENRAVFEAKHETASLDQIAMMGLHSWNSQANLSTQLMPLYLKTL